MRSLFASYRGNSANKLRSRFSYLTDAGTTLAKVFAYLNGELSNTLSQREGKQRAADALMAFWKPYALQAQNANPDQLQKAAQSSVEALFRQMQTICDDFEVEMPMMLSTELRKALIAVPPELRLALIAKHVQTKAEPFPPLTSTTLTTHSLTSPSLSQENDAIFVNDEDLLGDLE